MTWLRPESSVQILAHGQMAVSVFPHVNTNTCKKPMLTAVCVSLGFQKPVQMEERIFASPWCHPGMRKLSQQKPEQLQGGPILGNICNSTIVSREGKFGSWLETKAVEIAGSTTRVGVSQVTQISSKGAVRLSSSSWDLSTFLKREIPPTPFVF